MTDPRETLARIREQADARTTVPALLDALEKVIEQHRKGDYPRLTGFPRANEEEHYCMEDQRPWPCPTVAAITTSIEGLHND